MKQHTVVNKETKSDVTSSVGSAECTKARARYERSESNYKNRVAFVYKKDDGAKVRTDIVILAD